MPLQPTRLNERIPALDILRGFALFGVLIAYTVLNLGSPPEESYTLVDRILQVAVFVLIDTKFYTIFAFLFGLGFSIQLMRAESRGVNIVPVYCRRLLSLLLIGLIHALVLRNGDILVPYAVMGFFLLPLRQASNWVLLLVGIVGLIWPQIARSVWESSGVPFPQRPETQGGGYLQENVIWVRYWYSTAIVWWPASLPMFVFGLYMGRRRTFENLAAQRKGLRSVLIGGLVIGVVAFLVRLLIGAKFGAPASFALKLGVALLGSAHAWGLAAFYATSLLLLAQRPRWERRLGPVGAVGRMALTNYLLQAGLIVPICLVFDLFGRVTPTLGIVLALAVGAVQMPASVWWLQHYRFGPAEWLWRTLTYGYPQPMRMASEAKTGVGSSGE